MRTPLMKNYLYVLLVVLALAAIEQTIQFIYRINSEVGEVMNCACEDNSPQISHLSIK